MGIRERSNTSKDPSFPRKNQLLGMRCARGDRSNDDEIPPIVSTRLREQSWIEKRILNRRDTGLWRGGKSCQVSRRTGDRSAWGSKEVPIADQETSTILKIQKDEKTALVRDERIVNGPGPRAFQLIARTYWRGKRERGRYRGSKTVPHKSKYALGDLGQRNLVPLPERKIVRGY